MTRSPRFDYVDGYRDLGLRGGSVSYDRRGDAVLHAVRWAAGATISGRVTRTASGGSAALRVEAARAQTNASISWGAAPARARHDRRLPAYRACALARVR